MNKQNIESMTQTIVPNSNKRGVYHPVWTMNDTILTFFCEKWGVFNLLSTFSIDNSLDELANSYIGSTRESLKQQMLNFRYLLTNGAEGLSDVSVVQKNVFAMYDSYMKEDLKNVCIDIMDDVNTDEVLKKYNKILVDNDIISSYNKTQKLEKQKLKEVNEVRLQDAILLAATKLGKNPKKLVSMAEYMAKKP